VKPARGQFGVERDGTRAEDYERLNRSPLLRRGRKLQLQQLVQGEELRGSVKYRSERGFVIDVGAECTGLLEASEMRDGFPAGATLKLGEEVAVRVLGTEGGLFLTRRSGSLARPPRDTSRRPDSQAVAAFAELANDAAAWLEGEVCKMTFYGVFVKVPQPLDNGALVQGLLHETHFAPGFEDEAIVGGKVSVRVLEADVAGRRLSLTMRQ